jgi:general secretion pathway protein L
MMGRLVAKLVSVWHWWSDEILGLLPRQWRPGQDQVIALWRSDRLELWQRSGKAAIPLGPAAPITEPLILRLPGHSLWRRRLTLPRQALPFLRQILQNEMDRRTPWRADQVYFHASGERDPTDRASLAVTLTVLPKQALEPALAGLALRGWHADRVELSDNDDPALAGPIIALGDGQPLGVRPVGRRWPALVAGGLTLAALLSLLGQNAALALLESRVSAATAEARSTRALATELDRLRRHAHFPSQIRAETEPMIALLDRISRALPDDSWAQEIDIGGEKIEVMGISQDAARLLALVERENFTAAEFRAPITPAEGGGQKFYLKADLPQIAHQADHAAH